MTEPNVEYTPFASASEECKSISVTCVAASKAFNLAGLQSAAVIIPDEGLRNKIVRGLNSDEVAEPNAFAVAATIAAFTEGGEWLDELREYISENRKTAAKFIERDLPELKLVGQDATYLLWIDCSAVTYDAEKLCEYIRKNTGLFITAGNQYRGNGHFFVRINVACPRVRLLDGLARLKEGVNGFSGKK